MCQKINLKEDDWARVSDGINGNGSIVSEPRNKCTMYSRFHKLGWEPVSTIYYYTWHGVSSNPPIAKELHFAM